MTPAEIAAVEASLVTTRFGGRSCRVAPRLARILARCDEALHAEYTRAMIATGGGITQPTYAAWCGLTGVGGYRTGGGWHAKGLAIDVSYAGNGYAVCRTTIGRRVVLGGEAAGSRLRGVRAAFVEACDRACVALDGQPADLSARRAGESTGSVWDRWHRVSEAVRAYLAPYFPAVDAYDAGEADVLPGVVIPPQLAADYQALRVPLVVGSPSLSPRLTRNPARGLMDVPRAVAVALCDVGELRWGACDFGASESSDLMHWDTASRIASGA